MRDSKTRFIFYELEIPRQFETPKFRDTPKICRDPLFYKDHSIPLVADKPTLYAYIINI